MTRSQKLSFARKALAIARIKYGDAVTYSDMGLAKNWHDCIIWFDKPPNMILAVFQFNVGTDTFGVSGLVLPSGAVAWLKKYSPWYSRRPDRAILEQGIAT